MRAYTVMNGGRFRPETKSRELDMAEGSDVNYWNIVVVLGPILLALAIAWAIMRNRKSKTSLDVTERGTRENYRAEQRAHENEPGSGL